MTNELSKEEVVTELFSIGIQITSDGKRKLNVKKGTFDPPLVYIKEVLEWAVTVIITDYINAIIDRKLQPKKQELITPHVVMPKARA